nr:hypothetical protein GCM10020063_056960 [Dactylosporangium thailandense]
MGVRLYAAEAVRARSLALRVPNWTCVQRERHERSLHAAGLIATFGLLSALIGKPQRVSGTLRSTAW